MRVGFSNAGFSGARELGGVVEGVDGGRVGQVVVQVLRRHKRKHPSARCSLGPASLHVQRPQQACASPCAKLNSVKVVSTPGHCHLVTGRQVGTVLCRKKLSSGGLARTSTGPLPVTMACTKKPSMENMARRPFFSSLTYGAPAAEMYQPHCYWVVKGSTSAEAAHVAAPSVAAVFMHKRCCCCRPCKGRQTLMHTAAAQGPQHASGAAPTAAPCSRSSRVCSGSRV
jgi:hypothetical protein